MLNGINANCAPYRSIVDAFNQVQEENVERYQQEEVDIRKKNKAVMRELVKLATKHNISLQLLVQLCQSLDEQPLKQLLGE